MYLLEKTTKSEHWYSSTVDTQIKWAGYTVDYIRACVVRKRVLLARD